MLGTVWCVITDVWFWLFFKGLLLEPTTEPVDQHEEGQQVHDVMLLFQKALVYRVTHKGFVGFVDEPVVKHSQALVPPDPHKLHDRQKPATSQDKKQWNKLQNDSVPSDQGLWGVY